MMPLLGLVLAAALATQAPPVFESTVDLVSVDAAVLDGRGAPVRGLAASDFSVTVDGKPRRVLSAEYVDLGGASSPAPAAVAAPANGPLPAHLSTNQGLRPGRLVILAVDQGQIPSGQGRALIRSADKLLDQLGPADRVGLFAFPEPAPPGIEPTAEHQRVRAALPALVGRAPRLAGRRLSPAEAIAEQDGGSGNWQAAVQRECPDSMQQRDREMCVAELQAEAMQVLSDLRQSSMASLQTLRALFETVAKIEAPKTVVLITGGLWTEQPGDIGDLASRAAAARVTLYVMQLDSPFMEDASVQAPSATELQDRDLRANPLAALASLARGSVFRATGTGDEAFSRIARELSGHYLLGVEPDEADRDGREHAIRVSLERKGLSIRARGRVFIPRPGSGPTLEQKLAGTLRSPLAETGLTLRATTYVLRDREHPDALMVLVAGDVADARSAPFGCAVQLLDEKGAAVGTVAQRMETLGPAPLAFTLATAAPPGRYTLKLAVVDGTGRRGSLERPLELKLPRVSGVEVSELLLGLPPAANEKLRPGLDVTAGGAITAYLELYGARVDAARVSFEIAEAEAGPALVSLPGRLLGQDAAPRSAQLTIATDLLPPGDYLLRAAVELDGRRHPIAGRPFHVGATARVGGPVSFEMVRPALQRFDRAVLLRPEVVDHFLDRMQELLPGASSPALEQAIAHARAGALERVAPALASAGTSDARVLFLRGLAQLSQPATLPQAMASLRAAVQAAPALLPATVYLGGCLAANGEEREAVGAWQTSLLGESGSPVVYELLAEALLRLDDLERADSIIAEALESWPEDEGMKRRLGLVAARRGDGTRALELLSAHVEKHPDDTGAVFLTLRLLLQSFAATQGEATDAARRERALRYARSYVAANGPERQVVESWLRYLEKLPDGARP